MTSVVQLQSINFSSLTLNEKNDIKKKGRPIPKLKISQTSCSKSKKYERKFNSDVYEKYKWLCGCDVKNAFFCFPCLLYNGENSWTKVGVKDLVHLNEKIKKHEASKQHLKNVMDLALLGKVNIATQLSEAYRESIIKHNEVVRKNREILSKIIDAIKFCANFELPLRGHDETADSGNPGIFRGLLEYSGKLDATLKDHFYERNSF